MKKDNLKKAAPKAHPPRAEKIVRKEKPSAKGAALESAAFTFFQDAWSSVAATYV